ncbi:hypothetical protein J3459_006287 [Metarhizium acridum]|nr:hypothetical protein J3459_006287 [Metarhizium acridum]
MRFKALVGIHYLSDVVEAVHKVLIVFHGVVSSAVIGMSVHDTAHGRASTSIKLDALQGNRQFDDGGEYVIMTGADEEKKYDDGYR